jgi:hypothetical protein
MAAPLYLSAAQAACLLDPPSVLAIVEQALKALSVGRLVNGSKGGFTLD